MSYTDLGPYDGASTLRFTPYAARVAYAGKGRHHVKLSRSPLRRLRSLLRDAGAFIAVAWQPIAQAV